MDLARAEIKELKAEVEYERRLRQMAEARCRALARELTEERAGREAMERVCEGLAEVLADEREETERIMGEVEEERKMMRMAEVLREERVRMKLTEARILMEEKLREMEGGSSATVSVMDLYGEFEPGMRTKSNHCNKGELGCCKSKRENKCWSIGARYGRGSSCFGLSSSSSSGSISGRRNSACKESKCQPDHQLRIVLLREKPDFMV